MLSTQRISDVRMTLAPASSMAVRMCMTVRSLHTASVVILLGAGGFLAASAEVPAVAYVLLAVLVLGRFVARRFEVSLVARLMAQRPVVQQWHIVFGVTAVTAVLLLALPWSYAAIVVALGLAVLFQVRAHISPAWVEQFTPIASVHRFERHSRIVGVAVAVVVLFSVAVVGTVSTYQFSIAAALLSGLLVVLLVCVQAVVMLVLGRRQATLLGGVTEQSMVDFAAEPELSWGQTLRFWARPWRPELQALSLAGLFLAVLMSTTPVLAHHTGGPAGLVVLSGSVLVAVLLGAWLPGQVGVPPLQGRALLIALLLATVSGVVYSFATFLPLQGATAVVSGVLGGYVAKSALSAVNDRFLAQSFVKVAELLSVVVLLVAAALVALSGQSPTVGAKVEYLALGLLLLVALITPFVVSRINKSKGAKAQRVAAEGVEEQASSEAVKSASLAQILTPDQGERGEAGSDAAADVDLSDPNQWSAPVAEDSWAQGDAVAAHVAEQGVEQQSSLADGVFIAVEGGDGAGKSSVIEALAKALDEVTDQRIVITREPGGTAAGRRLRDLLLGNVPWTARAEALLFAADRAQHVDTVIVPTLEENGIVLSDRYVDSSIAYQGAGRALDTDEILALSRWATNDLTPDLTILLDIDPDRAAQRRAGDVKRSGPDRMEAEDSSFHEAVRGHFLELAQQEPHRYVVLDASVSQDDVVEAAIDETMRFFSAGPYASEDDSVVAESVEAAQGYDGTVAAASGVAAATALGSVMAFSTPEPELSDAVDDAADLSADDASVVDAAVGSGVGVDEPVVAEVPTEVIEVVAEAAPEPGDEVAADSAASAAVDADVAVAADVAVDADVAVEVELGQESVAGVAAEGAQEDVEPLAAASDAELHDAESHSSELHDAELHDAELHAGDGHGGVEESGVEVAPEESAESLSTGQEPAGAVEHAQEALASPEVAPQAETAVDAPTTGGHDVPVGLLDSEPDPVKPSIAELIDTSEASGPSQMPVSLVTVPTTGGHAALSEHVEVSHDDAVVTEPGVSEDSGQLAQVLEFEPRSDDAQGDHADLGLVDELRDTSDDLAAEVDVEALTAPAEVAPEEAEEAEEVAPTEAVADSAQAVEAEPEIVVAAPVFVDDSGLPTFVADASVSSGQTPAVTPTQEWTPDVVTEAMPIVPPAEAARPEPSVPSTPPVAALPVDVTQAGGEHADTIYGPNGLTWGTQDVPLTQYNNEDQEPTAVTSVLPDELPTSTQATTPETDWATVPLTADQFTGRAASVADFQSAMAQQDDDALGQTVPMAQDTPVEHVAAPVVPEVNDQAVPSVPPVPTSVAKPELSRRRRLLRGRRAGEENRAAEQGRAAGAHAEPGVEHGAAAVDPVQAPVSPRRQARTHVFDPNSFSPKAVEPEQPVRRRRLGRRNRTVDVRNSAVSGGSTESPYVGPPSNIVPPGESSSQRRHRFAKAEQERRERAEQRYQDWFVEGDYGDRNK